MVAPFTVLTGRLFISSIGVRGVVELDGILIGADLGEAGGHDLVLVGQGGLDVGGGKAVRLHRLGIQVEARPGGSCRHKGSGMAAPRTDDQMRTDEILRQVQQLLLRTSSCWNRRPAAPAQWRRCS